MIDLKAWGPCKRLIIQWVLLDPFYYIRKGLQFTDLITRPVQQSLYLHYRAYFFITRHLLKIMKGIGVSVIILGAVRVGILLVSPLR